MTWWSATTLARSRAIQAQLTVLLKPTILAPIPPLAITAVPGETISLGAQLHGALPIYCRWRLLRHSGGNVVVSNQTVSQPSTFISYTVAANSSGVFALILTNAAGGSLSTVTGTNAFLTVLADSRRRPDPGRPMGSGHGLHDMNAPHATPRPTTMATAYSNRRGIP